MFKFIRNRLVYLVIVLAAISLLSFFIIQLPPGDYLDVYIARMQESGNSLDQVQVEALKRMYGLDQPFHVQYLKWISNIILRGDFGYSLNWKVPVASLIWDRIGLTIFISLLALIFIWIFAIPIGIYSAVKQYSFFDYLVTFLSFVGLGIPPFLLALLAMWTSYNWLDFAVTGIFSNQYAEAPWSFAKLLDFLKHLIIPVIVLGMGGTAGLIRVLRANLLDELQKPYVVTSLAKGIKARIVILKHPFRVALNPFVSTIGWTLPAIVSGSVIVGTVLNIPTVGPMLLDALYNQDMYLAGGIVFLLGFLTIVGTVISDILLAILDPRIRIE
jgi:peptide/nickel transport system permease protein